MVEETNTGEETQEDVFSSINPEDLPTELKQLYKSMQGDYTRKTQDLAKVREEFTTKEESWQDRLKEFGGMEQRVKQWEDWYEALGEDGKQTTQTAQPGEPESQPQTNGDMNYLEEPGAKDIQKALADMQANHSKELSTLREELSTVQTSIKDTTDQTSRMFSYHAQLNDLGNQYEGLDKQELLDYALKNGQMDLTKAYKDLHQDQLIEAEVAKRVKDEVAKQRTQGIRNTGQNLLVKTRDNTPKSFEEATQQILDQRATEGL